MDKAVANDTHLELAHFQLNIAKRWRKKSEHNKDEFARFFFLFSAFNALYYLWGEADRITGERGCIEHLLGKLDRVNVDKALYKASSFVCFLSRRGRSIEDMRCRSRSNPQRGKRKRSGEQQWQRLLRSEHEDPCQRLIALGQIIYQVRCNLVHGGKAESGDDECVIKNAVPALDALLVAAMTATERRWLKT